MNKKVINKKVLIVIGFLLILYLKNLVFAAIGSSNAGVSFSGISFNITTIVPHMAILGIIVFPALFFRNRSFLRCLLIIDILYSILLIVDLWIYRGTGYFLDFKYFVYNDLFNVFNNSLFNPNKINILFFVDILIISIICRTKKDRITFNRNNLTGIISILVCFFIVFSWHYLFDIKRIAGSDIRFLQDDWEIAWNPSSEDGK